MNYISEIKALYDWTQTNPISADAQALWHALMYINNKCAICIDGIWLWRVEFTVSNQTLLSYLGFSRTQLDRMRNVLIQKGRIRYRKGKGNQCGMYQMIPFDAQYVAQTVTQSGTQVGVQLWRKRVPLNNNNITPNFNFISGDGEAPAPALEAENEVNVYLQDRGLDPFFTLEVTEEIRRETNRFADAVFKKFTCRRPTAVDYSNVFWCISLREHDDAADTWKITLPQERKKLLIYAFEEANEAGKPGDWRYIGGVLRKQHQRGIKSLDAAEDYDIEWYERA